MATTLFLVILVITPTLQDLANNEIDDPLEEVKGDIFKEQNLQNIGGLISNLMNSEGAKQLGGILSNAAAGGNAGDVLQGLGSVLGQANGLDPSMIGMVMNMMTQSQNKKDMDMNVLGSIFGAFMGQGGQGGDPNFWSYVPLLLQTANSFLGPEAERRAKSHSDHADLVPPLIEKLHLWFDHFINSEMGMRVINTIGAEKFIKIFADENGRMSYSRFVEMLENHSFRKHWIRMVTSRIASVVSHFSDRKTQRKYLVTFQHFLNSILKSQGFPKNTLFDPERPTDSLSSLIDHFVRNVLGMKVNSREYVKPFVDYTQDVFRLAENRGMLDVNSHELSDKLADTINLEVIEPIARVNRAYRFARSVNACDKYVMCLVNREPDEAKPSLPGLRPFLSKSASLVFSWFLTSQTGTTYWNFYTAIMDDTNCKHLYEDACHDFHLEEEKVKREIVHSEL